MSSERNEPRGAGWGWPGAARKFHYFEAGNVISLCGKWMFTGGLVATQDGGSPDDCIACARLLAKTKATS